jgi:hypothetical protein
MSANNLHSHSNRFRYLPTFHFSQTVYTSGMQPLLLAYPADVISLQLCTPKNCWCAIRVIHSL